MVVVYFSHLKIWWWGLIIETSCQGQNYSWRACICSWYAVH